VKSGIRITLSFGFDGLGSGLRERATMAVMDGLSRHWERTSEPMKPVQPVRMNFIVAVVFERLRLDGRWVRDYI